jgi:2-furoyl-CoA dehydrogenase FAD binding subunit
MKPPKFDYARAENADEAIALLAEYGDEARILAGGQSLMPMLNMRLTQPQVLIDISQIDELNFMQTENSALQIGASTTQAALEWRDTLANEVPLLTQAFPHISHFQIRNRGTVCGSIAHADPSAELPLCLLALGGEVVLRSKATTRVVPANEFFLGTLRTAREPDELIESIRFPLAKPDQRFAFDEFSMRHGDYAIAAVAAVADAAGLRFAVGGVADRPVSQYWRGFSGDGLDGLLNDFALSLEAQDDQHASAGYRKHLVRTLGKKVIGKVLS